MTNSELLKSVLKEIESARIEQANLDINNTRDYNWYNKHIRSISSIYEDIKNLSGNTVKLREECPVCRTGDPFELNGVYRCLICMHEWTLE